MNPSTLLSCIQSFSQKFCFLPVQASFVENVAKHAEAGVITGISDIRDESDRDGMRVVVELKRAVAPEVSRASVPSTGFSL
jgi:DNA gyrase/topoisomerase IV subunit A